MVDLTLDGHLTKNSPPKQLAAKDFDRIRKLERAARTGEGFRLKGAYCAAISSTRGSCDTKKNSESPSFGRKMTALPMKAREPESSC